MDLFPDHLHAADRHDHKEVTTISMGFYHDSSPRSCMYRPVGVSNGHDGYPSYTRSNPKLVF
jgi:hypothetical protein